MASLNYMQSGHKSTVPMCFHSPFIEYGYRSTNYFSEAFFSVFSFHNEIMNIWSHLIGFICVLVAGYQISLEFFSDYDKFYEIIALETYILCASICLLLSSIYHWFGCLSEGHHENLLKMDLTGVALLTAGSYFAAVYYGFYCTPTDQTVHLGLTCLVLVVGLIAPWVEFKVNGTNIRPFIFMSLVILGLVPFIHWVVITPTVFRDELVQGFLWIFFWYGVGFTMYMSRLPERLFPNSLIATHIFPSHTLWHICVLNAVYVCFHFLLKYRSLLSDIGCKAYDIDAPLACASYSAAGTCDSGLVV